MNDAIAWRRIKGCFGVKRFMTQRQYDLQSPKIKLYYEPFRCEHCEK